AVKVGLVAWPASIHAIQVEPRCPEVNQRSWIILPLQAADGIEREIVVDELAKVRIAGADSGILFIICFRLRRWRSLEFGRHRCGEIVQDARIKLRGWQRAEHAPKAALELVRSALRLEAANHSVTPHRFVVRHPQWPSFSRGRSQAHRNPLIRLKDFPERAEPP